MANNVPITAGSGTNIATEQDGSAPNEHYQLIKLVNGTAGDYTPITATSGALDVHIANASLAVTAAALPLPSGASTAAKQPALGTAGSASADVLTVQGVASMTPLLVNGSGATQPVSGTVTANAGTNLNTSALALESGGNLATLAGAVSSSKVQANVAQMNGVTVLMGNGNAGTGAQRVTIAADNTPFAVKTDQTTHGTTDLVAADITKLAGTAVSVNSGNKDAGTLRVVLATDQVALTNKLLVTPDLPSGASTAAKQPALGTAGSASSDVLSVQGIASMTPFLVGGTAAAGASASGNPVRLGALGRSTTPTAVSSAQMVDILADRLGRLYRVAPICTVVGSAASAITTATTTTAIAAPSAGNHLRIHRIWAQNSATATWLYFCDDTTKRVPVYLATGQPFSMNMDGRWELTSAKALKIITSSGSCNIEWYVEYETLAD